MLTSQICNRTPLKPIFSYFFLISSQLLLTIDVLVLSRSILQKNRLTPTINFHLRRKSWQKILKVIIKYWSGCPFYKIKEILYNIFIEIDENIEIYINIQIHRNTLTYLQITLVNTCTQKIAYRSNFQRKFNINIIKMFSMINKKHRQAVLAFGFKFHHTNFNNNIYFFYFLTELVIDRSTTKY